MSSAKDERHKVAEEAYTTLYEELRWHDDYHCDQPTQSFNPWVASIGEAPSDIYEIGSGRGQLLQLLAEVGHRCKGTEVTSERGERYDDEKKIRWGTTDGIQLDQFEPVSSYDVVLSNQVVEHLHPEDIGDHLRSTARILRPGGSYIHRLRTDCPAHTMCPMSSVA